MWWHPEHGGRTSPLRVGEPAGLAVGGDAVRGCTGVWRAGRRSACPYGAELAPQVRREQCEGCLALDRASSVAADTRADDPRPFAVYLAYFGPGLLKVGITAAERGRVRLLEQAAVGFAFLGKGPLMAARRTEAVLGAALRVPDRVRDPAKRAARYSLPPPAEREAEVAALHAEVTSRQADLPTSLRLAPFAFTDLTGVFGLDRQPPLAAPAAEVTALASGCALTGTVLAVAGHDLHLATPEGPLLLDTRLTAGWPLQRPPGGTPAPPPTAPLRLAPGAPQSLF
ncbi:DUF2797 domain-containing protein [Actinacidiphila guanduensis]|uniref:DUF2797 domain-containing protein n=1 Tax=Actinacidiphila guanduensis TaxID=310781 RepID=A0A1H0I0X5_9ACTN|nr:DUF2797 domain-containing protein [Actinacidiphila guanduensis]SDO25034.1 Protein of unknown function [Actinacidiphila guanduensis]